MIHKAPLPQDIDERLCSLETILASCGDVIFAYLFGSVAEGRRSPLSDVDLGVYLRDEGNDLEEARLKLLARVTGHLGTEEVDLVLLNRAPIALLGRLLQSRRVLLDNAPFLRHRFESRAIREFLDFRIFEHRLLKRRFRHG
jgi:predicted nucleotidyltransferase